MRMERGASAATAASSYTDRGLSNRRQREAPIPPLPSAPPLPVMVVPVPTRCARCRPGVTFQLPSRADPSAPPPSCIIPSFSPFLQTVMLP